MTWSLELMGGKVVASTPTSIAEVSGFVDSVVITAVSMIASCGLDSFSLVSELILIMKVFEIRVTESFGSLESKQMECCCLREFVVYIQRTFQLKDICPKKLRPP